MLSSTNEQFRSSQSWALLQNCRETHLSLNLSMILIINWNMRHSNIVEQRSTKTDSKVPKPVPIFGWHRIKERVVYYITIILSLLLSIEFIFIVICIWRSMQQLFDSLAIYCARSLQMGAYDDLDAMVKLQVPRHFPAIYLNFV